MKVTTKGQVTIPAQVREFLSIQPHDDVTFVVSGDQVILQKSDQIQTTGRFADLLGCRKTGHTSDELMKILRPYAFDNNDPALKEDS